MPQWVYQPHFLLRINRNLQQDEGSVLQVGSGSAADNNPDEYLHAAALDLQKLGGSVQVGSGPDKAILQSNISCSCFEHEICFCEEFRRMWFCFWFWSDGSSDLRSPSLSCSSSPSSSSADGGEQLPVSMSHRQHTGSDVSGGKDRFWMSCWSSAMPGSDHSSGLVLGATRPDCLVPSRIQE